MSNVAKVVQEQYGPRKQQGKRSDKVKKDVNKRRAKKCMQKVQKRDFCGENFTPIKQKSVRIVLKKPLPIHRILVKVIQYLNSFRKGEN